MNTATRAYDFARYPARLVCKGKTLSGPVAFFEWLFGRSVAKAALASVLVRIDDGARERFAEAVEHPDPAFAVSGLRLIVSGAGGGIRHFIARTEATDGARKERALILDEYSFEDEGHRLEARIRAAQTSDALALTIAHDLGNLVTLLKMGHELALDGESSDLWNAAMSKLLLLADTLGLGFGDGSVFGTPEGDLALAVERAARLLEASFDVTMQVERPAGAFPACAAAQEHLDTAAYLALIGAVRTAGPHGTVRAVVSVVNGEATVRITIPAAEPVTFDIPDLHAPLRRRSPLQLYRFGCAEAFAITAKSGGRSALEMQGSGLFLAWPLEVVDSPDPGPLRHAVVVGHADVVHEVVERIEGRCERIETYAAVAAALNHARAALNDAVWFLEVGPEWTGPDVAGRLQQAIRSGVALIVLARSAGHETYARALCPDARILRWPCGAWVLEQAMDELGGAA